MKRSLFVFLAFFVAQAAAAQSVRTFVATTGLDTNPCSRTQPCRNFAAAIAAVMENGEVVVLDSGGYGPVTIAKAVTIVAPAGIHAAIAPTSGDAITSNPASGTVSLKGLYLRGHGADYGIHHTGSGFLRLEDVTAEGFAQIGVWFHPMGSSSLYMLRSSVRGNAFRGVVVGAMIGGSTARATIDMSRAESTGTVGIMATSYSRVAIYRSVSAGNVYGFAASANADSTAVMVIEQSVASHNAVGVAAGPGEGAASIHVANSVISLNGTGVESSGGGGATYTRQNNTFRGNTTDGTFTGTFAGY